MEYLERIDDELLKRKLHSSAAVLIEGPKWCGKTSTGAQLAKSIIYIQNPDQRAMYRKMADTQPSLLLTHARRMADDSGPVGCCTICSRSTATDESVHINRFSNTSG